MSAVTVFLVVMILSLGLGNALFIIVKRGGKATKVQGRALSMGEDSQVSAARLGAGHAAQEQVLISTAPMAQKIELAHARLQALESRVKSIQGIYGEPLRAKIDKLEAFRDTANAEIIAVKEILDGMQKKNTFTGEGTKGIPAAEKDISTEEMRRLIYNKSQT